MRTPLRTSRRAWTVALVVMTLLFAAAGPATAAPSVSNAKIRARQAQAAAASKRLDDLSATLEMRAEDLAQVEQQLETVRQQIMVAEDELAQQNADLDAAQAQLDTRAENIYRDGRVDFISVFVGVSSFDDFLSRLDLMRRISNSDASAVSQVKIARAKVEYTRQTLSDRSDQLSSLRDQAREAQNQVALALAAQKAYLASIRRDISRLIAAERVRQEKLAKERAARLGVSFDPSRLHGAHADVARIALRYLGVKYVWGGTTPAGFDCSGLCQYCYAQVGIALPRTSREQFHAGAYIPPDRKDLLQAGDLVFFGFGGDPNRIHHVGIYLGGGDFINAPQTGDVVRIAALSSRGDYVGACRP